MAAIDLNNDYSVVTVNTQDCQGCKGEDCPLNLAGKQRERFMMEVYRGEVNFIVTRSKFASEDDYNEFIEQLRTRAAQALSNCGKRRKSS